MGADIVDVNMGCPVPKIAKHNAGCSLMREPAHAQAVVSAMAKAVKIPVTVKMRAGWNEQEINAPELARRMEDAGARRARGARPHGGAVVFRLVGLEPDRSRRARPSGFRCSAAAIASSRRSSSQKLTRTAGVAGVLVGRGALRNPWIFEQAAALARGERPREITMRGARAVPAGLHRPAAARAHRRSRRLPSRRPDAGPDAAGPTAERGGARGHDRWVINKLRALNSWYTKGLDNGSHLRVSVNAAESIPQLREIIAEFFSTRLATT